MEVILVIAISLDGRSTKWDSPTPSDWTSKEDQEYFPKLIKSNTCIVMGGNTFRSAKTPIKPTPGVLKIIMTRKPLNQYAQYVAPGALEFTNESPSVLCKKLAKNGHKKILLVGGEKLNSEFFKAGLVTQVWVTIEPKIFGQGNGIVDEKLDVQLRLINIKKMNAQGTLLAKYNVVWK